MKRGVLLDEIRKGRLAHVMHEIPLQEWQTPGNDFMKAAVCVPGNGKAIGCLVRQGASIAHANSTYLHFILSEDAYEAICANAKSLSETNYLGDTPLYKMSNASQHKYVNLLIKYGARLQERHYFAWPETYFFQNRVRQCRLATIVMIRMNLTGAARHVWATRCDGAWENHADLNSLRSIEFAKLRLEELQAKKARIEQDIHQVEMSIGKCTNDIITNSYRRE